MATPVYMIFMNGADKSWLIVREETWNRLHGGSNAPKIIEDLEWYVHPDDLEEYIEVLDNFALSKNDIALYLPPMAINNEIAEFTNVSSLTEFVNRHHLTIVGEFTCYP